MCSLPNDSGAQELEQLAGRILRRGSEEKDQATLHQIGHGATVHMSVNKTHKVGCCKCLCVCVDCV